MFYPLSHTASQRTKLPTQFKVVLMPSDSLISFLSLKALTALKDLWSSPGSGQWGLFSRRECIFPFLMLFASVLLANPSPCTTSYSCCDFILEQVYNPFPVLSVGMKTLIDYSWDRGVQPKGLCVCTCRSSTISCEYSAKNDLEGSLDAVCIQRRTKRYQDPIARPPYSVVLATSGTQI